MTDRDDGTIWKLIHDSVETLVGIDDSGVGNDTFFTVYGPFEGPWLPREPTIRIFIRGGRLGYEIQDLPVWLADRDQHRVMTRDGAEQFIYELIVPVGSEPWQQFPDELGYEEFEL